MAEQANPNNATNGVKEIRMNPPKTFDGTRNKCRKFLQDAELYMLINTRLYDNDLTKIGFVLSFMNEGQAAAWADQFVESHALKVSPQPLTSLGTYDDFRKQVLEAFAAYDSPGEALSLIKNLRMKGTDPVDEHIAKFKTLVSESRIEPDSLTTIDLFRESLTAPLQRRILTLDNPPTTLEQWYKWAAKIDFNWKRMQIAIGRTQGFQQKGKTQQQTTKKFYFPRKDRDPNAMDVDAMELEERTKLMKEGRCFKCKKTGHLASACPDKNGKQKEERKYEPKKMDGKQLHTHIRTLFKQMTDEDKDQFMEEAQNEGFC